MLPNMQDPIFVVGANRSGTTLLRLMLNAHSHIAIPDELTYITPYLGGAGIQNWKDPGFSPSRYRSFVQRFVTSKDEESRRRQCCCDSATRPTRSNRSVNSATNTLLDTL